MVWHSYKGNGIRLDRHKNTCEQVTYFEEWQGYPHPPRDPHCLFRPEAGLHFLATPTQETMNYTSPMFLAHRNKLKLCPCMPWRCTSGTEIKIHTFKTFFFLPEQDPVQSAQQLDYEMSNWGVRVRFWQMQKVFLFITVSRPASGHTQPPFNWLYFSHHFSKHR